MSTIVLIEDEKILLEEIVAILELENYIVYPAGNGEEGVQLIREIIPDLIISDIMMPHMDGYAVLNAIQQDPKLATIPFLFLTAKNDPQDVRLGMSLGVDDYLPKPFKVEDLLLAIATRLKRRALLIQKYQQKIDDLEEVIASTMPHELRTPLVSVLGYSEILIEEATEMDTPQIIEMARTIHQAGAHLHQRINKLLILANLKYALHHNEQHLQRQEELAHDVEAQITNAVERVVYEYQRMGDVYLHIESATLRMRSEDLYLLTRELVENACKFSKPSTVIKVVTFRKDDRYLLQIRDHGIGMTADQINSIAVFRQFNRSLQQQTGLGLGLAIVITLTELYQGSIAFTPYVHDGLMVEVQLPLVNRNS